MAKRMIKVVRRKGKVISRRKVRTKQAAVAKKQVAKVVEAPAPVPANIKTVKPIVTAKQGTMVTLEDRQIAQMLADPRFNEAIPCVQSGSNQMKKITQRCGRCNAKRKKAKSSIMKQARACIVGMNKKQKANLKKLLGSDNVQVLVANGKGVKTVKL